MKAIERTTLEAIRITSRAEDYSQWYLDVIAAADLAEYGPTKGSMIIKPLGYEMWEKVQAVLNEQFKSIGVKNVYFPMLIPERFLKKEESHIEGFSPEVAVVTYAGGQKLEEALVIRPTSETIMYDTFSKWIQSYQDLPLIINQWANVVRWEMRPRLFLRTTEFLWQEGHTAHSNHDEADNWAKKILDIYALFAKEYMAIPVISGVKTDSEKFAGALRTYCVEAMMQDGKALQFATSHNLGQNFSKPFSIQFSDENNKGTFVWQTSWGLSTRTIGALIMVHGDDKGLVLPPRMAPIQIAIIPIWKSEESRNQLIPEARKLHDELVAKFGNTAVVIDERDIRPGQKHYHWEKKGVPVRIEIGPRDVENKTVVAVRRDTSEKKVLTRNEVVKSVGDLLADIQQSLYKNAVERMKNNIIDVTTYDEFVKQIENGKFVRAYWGGDTDIEKKIKDETKATIRCLPLTLSEDKSTFGKCVFSGKTTSVKAIFARSY